jgi:DNA-binding MarR family transcriptional regulator
MWIVRDGRRQVLQLTQSGYERHDRLIAIAAQRESLILADLPEEIAGLTTTLRRLHARRQRSLA